MKIENKKLGSVYEKIIFGVKIISQQTPGQKPCV